MSFGGAGRCSGGTAIWSRKAKAQGSIRGDIDTDLIVAELFAWIWWEDLSYLEGLDTEATLEGFGQHVRPSAWTAISAE